MKYCPSCKQDVALTGYSPSLRDKAWSNCRECYRADRASRAGNSEHTPEKWRLRKYGMTTVQFDEMHSAQGGCCAICNEQIQVLRVKGTKFTCVDHCHETGRVRGLLCYPCNTAIGLLRESPLLLESAAKYLAAQTLSRKARSLPRWGN